MSIRAKLGNIAPIMNGDLRVIYRAIDLIMTEIDSSQSQTSYVVNEIQDVRIRDLAYNNITLTAGSGLLGGGDLTADRRFDIGVTSGLFVVEDTVGINYRTRHWYSPSGNFASLGVSGLPGQSADMFTWQPSGLYPTHVTGSGFIGVNDPSPTAQISTRAIAETVPTQADVLPLAPYSWWSAQDIDASGTQNAGHANLEQMVGWGDKTGNGHYLPIVDNTFKSVFHISGGPNNKPYVNSSIGGFTTWLGTAFGNPAGWTAFFVIQGHPTLGSGGLHLLRGATTKDTILAIPYVDEVVNPLNASFINNSVGGGTNHGVYKNPNTPSTPVAWSGSSGFNWHSLAWTYTGSVHRGFHEDGEMSTSVPPQYVGDFPNGTRSLAVSDWRYLFKTDPALSNQNVNVTEIILFDRSLSDGERNTVRTWLAHQYNSAFVTAVAPVNLEEWKNSVGTVDSVLTSGLKWGLGTSSPTEKLDVSGNIRGRATIYAPVLSGNVVSGMNIFGSALVSGLVGRFGTAIIRGQDTDTRYWLSGSLVEGSGLFQVGANLHVGSGYGIVVSDSGVRVDTALLDQRWLASGLYETSGTSYTKAEANARFQASGLYQISGTSYTKAESDSRYAFSGTGGSGVTSSGTPDYYPIFGADGLLTDSALFRSVPASITLQIPLLTNDAADYPSAFVVSDAVSGTCGDDANAGVYAAVVNLANYVTMSGAPGPLSLTDLECNLFNSFNTISVDTLSGNQTTIPANSIYFGITQVQNFNLTAQIGGSTHAVQVPAQWWKFLPSVDAQSSIDEAIHLLLETLPTGDGTIGRVRSLVATHDIVTSGAIIGLGDLVLPERIVDNATFDTLDDYEIGDVTYLGLSKSDGRNLVLGGIAGGYDGRILVIQNEGDGTFDGDIYGPSTITMTIGSSSSAYENQFYWDRQNDFFLNPGTNVVLQYNAHVSRWVVVGGTGFTLAGTVDEDHIGYITTWTGFNTFGAGSATDDGEAFITRDRFGWAERGSYLDLDVAASLNDIPLDNFGTLFGIVNSGTTGLITGFTCDGTPSRLIRIYNANPIGSGVIRLRREASSSSNTNRFYNGLDLYPGECADLWFDQTLGRWRVFGGSAVKPVNQAIPETFNLVPVQGQGFTSVYAYVDASNRSADIGSTNFANIVEPGLYRVTYYLNDHNPDVTAGTVTVTLAWNDGDASRTFTSAAVSMTAASNAQASGSVVVKVGSGNISYSTSHTGTYGTAAYSLMLSVERIA